MSQVKQQSLINFMKLVALLLAWSTLLTLAEGKRVKRIVGGKQAKAPPPDDPVVFTRAFKRDARVEGFRNPTTRVYSFLGLYYAEPPTGENRYTRPIYKRLTGDITATKYGPPCLQPDPYKPQNIIGDENCLLLNVFTPQMPDESTGLPVYVWIHPGGFRYGSAAQYDATPMAQNGLIVVVPQYRLGSLGVIGEGSKKFDGNLAMFDMATALRWVADYIKYFGGDPNQVKIIGHGSGAASAMYLSMSRATRSAADFNGVVAMSGTAISQYAMDKDPVISVKEVATINGCQTTNETVIVNCLREKSAKDIIRNDNDIQTERLAGRLMVKTLSGSVGFHPHSEVEDDERGLPSLLIGDPESILKNHSFIPIPLLTGVVAQETANALSLNVINEVFGTADKFLDHLKTSLMELGSLLRVDQITGKILKPELPGLVSALTPALEDVLRLPANLGINELITKLEESTTDIFFNLPMVLTTQLWSTFSTALMYSFEYKGKRSKGVNFLRGLPIVNGNNSDKIAHGDEIGYLFDANDIFGNPLPEARLRDKADLTVRKNMIDLLGKFATPTKKIGNFLDDLTGNLLSGLSGKKNPYIKINRTLDIGEDFRFCELSVLGATLQPLASTSCQYLGSLLETVGLPLGSLGSSLGNVGSNLGGFLGASLGGNGNSGSSEGSGLNLLGSGKNKNSGGLLGLG